MGKWQGWSLKVLSQVLFASATLDKLHVSVLTSDKCRHRNFSGRVTILLCPLESQEKEVEPSKIGTCNWFPGDLLQPLLP